MEKLILHLSPVTRRKSLRNSTGATSAANRRTMSEPNKNRMLLLNNGSSRTAHAQQHHNNVFVKKASLSSDLKAVAMVAVHEVYRVARRDTLYCCSTGWLQFWASTCF